MTRFRILPASLVFILLSLVASRPLLAQRSDRAVIGGVVTDAQGSAVPGATVTVRNDATGVDTTLVTNSAGAYTTQPLVLGPYSVKVNLTGFKTSLSSGIVLRGGDVVRHDVTLQLGAVTETIEVTAEEGLNVTRPDVSHKVDEKYYRDLPIVTAADVRLAESVLLMQPGYLPMKPNGDPMFRGSQFGSRINGGQTRAVENFFDGGAFGYASGHQQSQESAPPVEAIQEVTVITTTYSAEYGHTSGGFIEYTSKSGTNTLHGSLYGYFANDALNTRGFFAQGDTPLKNNNFGFTAGGPIKKNKTFFFTNVDWTKFSSTTLPGFGNTTPIDAFKAGNFSQLLTTNQIGTDVLGRPIFGGQIFNPATSRLVNGIPVRDPYPGNIIPAGDPLRSRVAAQITSLMVHPDRAGLSNNVAGNPAGDQTWDLDARVILARLDHEFTPRHRLTLSGYYNNRPSIRNCGGVQGCTTQFSGETEPEKNVDYYGNGFYQRIYTTHAHSQFDWIIRDNLMSHSTVAWDRWYMGGNSLSAGVGWPQKLWGSQQQSGILAGDAGPPIIRFFGNIPYSELGQDWARFGFEKNDRWQFSSDMTWIKGTGTIKAGFEYRAHKYPQQGWGGGGANGGRFDFNRLGTGGYDALGNNLSQTGDPFASFLLGQTHEGFQQIPVYPEFHEGYFSPWINGAFKVTKDLTLNAGLRFDYQTARTEANDQYSTFDPNTPNPGAGGHLGALIFAGDGPGRAGTRTFERPKKDAWGPRAGFAYRINDKTAIRGGYGIYYANVAFSQFIGNPTLGFSSNNLAPNLTNGFSPTFHLDSGFPSDRIRRPPFIDPTFANGGEILYVPENGLTLPRFQNWSVTLKRRLSENIMVDVSYIGNKGSRLNHHWQRRGLDANMNDPAILALGAAVLNANINSPLAQQAGIRPPYAGFNGNVAQALRKYPQYQGVLARSVPLGRSIYHALEFVLEQRVAKGLQYRIGYTFSRLKNNGAESGQGNEGINGGVQDPLNWDEADWGLSNDDTPHVLLVGFTWDLPSSSSWTGVKKALLHGWNVSGILRYESGRPLNIFMANDMGGFLFNSQKRPNRVSGTEAVAAPGDFDPNTDNYFNRNAWTDPGPLKFGNAPKNDGTVRGFAVYNEDVNVSKSFQLTNRTRLRFEGMVGNLLNRTTFCDPERNWSSGSFGRVFTQCNQARSVQLGVRVDF